MSRAHWNPAREVSSCFVVGVKRNPVGVTFKTKVLLFRAKLKRTKPCKAII